MGPSLRSLSDHELLTRIHALVARERKITLEVIVHLIEIERRALHLKHGYSTMFEYCTVGLGYSASAAMRRIQAARCVAEFPEVRGLLEANQVNLSTIGIVAKHLTHQNHAAVLERIKNKSQREVEAIVAELTPLAAMPRDRVRTVVVRLPVKTECGSGHAPDSLPLAPAPSGSEVKTGCRSEHESDALPLAPARAHPGAKPDCRNGNESVPTQMEERAIVQFSAGKRFMAKVARIRALAAHRLPANATLEQVFELALDCLLEKHDPAHRHARREVKGIRSRPNSTSIKSPRAIPASVRDQVFVRDQHRCAYVSPEGKRCESRHALQIDHRLPIARGGSGKIDNLRLLCAKHNRFEAERLMGPVAELKRADDRPIG
jgi:5-methylcytosine-specific restriction endonuclease McrA